MTRKISIDPITRLEGHGKIEIFLDDDGAVEDCYLPDPRAARLRALRRGPADRGAAAHRDPHLRRVPGEPPHGQRQGRRRLLRRRGGAARRTSCARCTTTPTSSTATSPISTPSPRPTSSCGPDADPAERNVLGVVAKVGLEIGGAVIESRGQAQEIQRIMGGRIDAGHLVPARRRRQGTQARGARSRSGRWSTSSTSSLSSRSSCSRTSCSANPAYVDIIVNGPVHARRAQHGPGRREQRAELLRRQGARRRLRGQGALQVRGRSTTPTTSPSTSSPGRYLKFPYLKKRGWKGFVEGIDSSIYCATPLARLNVADRMATPQGAGSLRRDVRDARWASVPGAACQPLGAAGGDGAERRDAQGVLRRPRDHRRRVPGDPAADHRRGHRHRRGDARDADAPLHLRRERHLHERQPHRRHDQQQRAHPDGHQEGRQCPDQARARSPTRASSTWWRWRSGPSTLATAAPPTACRARCRSRSRPSSGGSSSGN